MRALRNWILLLEQAIARDDRAAIKAVLKEAVPEFGAVPAADVPSPAMNPGFEAGNPAL
jgi:O-antigen biosynthesis protein WbqV